MYMHISARIQIVSLTTEANCFDRTNEMATIKRTDCICPRTDYFNITDINVNTCSVVCDDISPTHY